MSKRPGATEDGARYNKLQRPDEWPATPARRWLFETPTNKNAQTTGATASASQNSIGKLGEFSGNTNAENEDRDHRQHQEDYEDHEDQEDQEDREIETEAPLDAWNLRKPRKRNGKPAYDGCLPTGDGSDSGSENENSFAARQYLKSVRAQAQDYQTSTSAVGSQPQTNLDDRGYYEDGAYVVAPDENIHASHIDDEDDKRDADNSVMVTAYQAFTDSTVARFLRLRDSIRSRSATSENGLDVISFQRMKKNDSSTWGFKLNNSSPNLDQVAVTSSASILSLIEVFSVQCLRRKTKIRRDSVKWISSLLAALDEHTLDSEAVSVLRELAKKAIWLRIDFEPRFAVAAEVMGKEAGYHLDETQSEIISDDKEGSPMDFSSVDGDETASTGSFPTSTTIDDETRVALDMIVTIAGIVFGQRDLLESRAVLDWPFCATDGS